VFKSENEFSTFKSMKQGNIWYPLGPLYTTSGVPPPFLMCIYLNFWDPSLDILSRIRLIWDINRKEKI